MSPKKPARLRFLSPLHRASREIALHLQPSMSELTGTSSDAHVVSFLGSYGPCTISDLARVFGHKPSTLTSLLDRLEAFGLAQRIANPADKRSFLVELTAEGREHARSVRRRLLALEREIAARVSARELQGFDAVMRAIGDVTNIRVREESP